MAEDSDGKERREGKGEGATRMGEGKEGGREGGAGDLLLSGDLMRVAEEEERRLLMPASGGCFRFIVDVERLSTRREEERQTREAGFTLEVSQRGRAFRCKQGGSTRFCGMPLMSSEQCDA